MMKTKEMIYIMAIESGVKGYLIGHTAIEIGFPIDFKDNCLLACKFCKLYNGRRCIVTDEIIPFPDNHIGECCPLEFQETTTESEDK